MTYLKNKIKSENDSCKHSGCQCNSPGFCTRYGVHMSDSLHHKCQTSATWRENFNHFFTEYPSYETEPLSPSAYEDGESPMPINPPDEVPTDQLDDFIQEVEQKGVTLENYQVRQEGLGDLISDTLSKLGITEETVKKWSGIGGCGCGKRKKFLNRILPFRKKE